MSKAYQLALKMIREGLVNVLNDPVQGPPIIAELQARVGVPTGGELLTAIRDAMVANPLLATQNWNVQTAQKIASGDSMRFAGGAEVSGPIKPGDTMAIGTRTLAEVLADPFPSPVEFEQPEILENLVTASALVGGGGGGGTPDVSVTLTPPANRLVGETYTASVNPSGSAIQWQLDGVDVTGETATTFIPTDPGRVNVRSGSVVSSSVWARKGPIFADHVGWAGGAPLSATLDLGADYPHKVAYLLVMGYRSAGAASVTLSINGTPGTKIASSIFDETTRFGQLYALADPGTSMDVTYAGSDLQFVAIAAITAAGFAADASVDFGFDSVSGNDATSASVSLSNDAHGLLLAHSERYHAFPQGPAILTSFTEHHVLGDVLTSANSERTITATRTGNIDGKRFVVASIAPLPDVAP